MKKFIYYFLGIMDANDKKNFKKYIIVLFFGSIFAVLGIGAVIPFINLLIQPTKVMAFSWFHGYDYLFVVVFLTVVLVVAFAIKNLAAFYLLRYQSNLLFGLIKKIQQKLFSGYMSLPYEYHLNRSTPAMIKNINNETTILSGTVIAPLGVFLTESASSFFVLIVLLVMNPIFTLCVIASVFMGIFIFMRRIRVRLNHFAQLRTNAWTAMTDVVLSGLAGIKEAKLYHCEDRFVETFCKHADQLKLSGSFQATYQQSPRMLIEFIGLTVVLSVLCGFVVAGSNPTNLLVLLGVFGVSAAQLLPSLNRLTQAIVNIKYGFPALKIIFYELQQVSNEKRKQAEKHKNIHKLSFKEQISVHEIHYKYKDGTIALRGVNLEVYKGKKIAIVGKSGAGKTTLVDLMMGLYQTASGKIQVDGKVVQSENDISSYQKLFAYIPQSIVLFDRSIKENIAFGSLSAEIDVDRVWHCLTMACLDEFVNGMSLKENTCIGEGGIRLSGGQRQRIGIARALYQQPEILVMDEATSSLDNYTENDVTSLISNLKDLTIVTVAHRLSTIKNYDLIYVLDQGRVVASGCYESLLSTSEAFQKMVMHTKKTQLVKEDCL